ncbi:MAG: EamA family transporter [Oceanospirillaceae bacterium]|nr:EamA family transporter [Oceanospirillaceae bacterium]MAR01450.1 EamA family transporter [Oceanospirillaceae bacterium]|tara:strand:+ start:53485 stop:54387 length:903 start_codon:yes stop_codon:yes gene_type:complete
MKLLSAYLAVIFIWSSTPLGIQFTLEGLDFYTSASLRMWGSAVLSLPMVYLLGQRLAFSAAALKSYLAGSVGVYGAMLCVYWGAAYIPSGLISVIYGLTPMLSGAIAYFWLREKELTPVRILALVIALSGLTLVVSGRISFDAMAWKGILGSFLSTLLFAFSGVWVKRINADVHPVVQTSGTLWVSSFFYLLTVPLFGFHWPEVWPLAAVAGLGYLILFGSLLAFLLYFYILRNLPTARVMLITLMAPVLALMWGFLLHDETLQSTTLSGVFLLLAGLSLYQWHRRFDLWVGQLLVRRPM